jgi:hypothetical protein
MATFRAGDFYSRAKACSKFPGDGSERRDCEGGRPFSLSIQRRNPVISTTTQGYQNDKDKQEDAMVDGPSAL